MSVGSFRQSATAESPELRYAINFSFMVPSAEAPDQLLRQLIHATQHRALWNERMVTAAGNPLGALVNHAIRTVPFYGRWASGDGSGAATFQRLPVVTKTEIRKYPDAFRSRAFDQSYLHWETTSGTTGVPLRVCYDEASRYYDIYEIYSRFLEMIPGFRRSFRPGGVLIILVNDNIDRHPFTAIHPTLHAGLIHQVIIGRSDRDDEQLVERLRITPIPLLAGRPRALARLRDLDSSIRVDTNSLRPGAIIASGDNLLRRSRLIGQLPGRKKLKTGSRLLVSRIPRNQIHPVLLWGAVKLVGSRRPVGKVGETHCVFPGLSIGDRAGAVRRGSAQPTVHKFIAPPRHRVRRPVPSPPSIGRGKPHPVFASRVPDADAADYTSRRTRQGCASVRCRRPLVAGRPIRASPSTTSARQRCCRGSVRVHPC